MSLSSRLEHAFASNNVTSAAMVIVDEKSSVSLVDRLDEVASRALHKNRFENVTLILQAVEQLISKDQDCISRLVNQGVVIKLLNWFERVSYYLKVQQNPTESSLQLVAAFYEVSMSLCQSNIEESSEIFELLLLRFGAVVIDKYMKFGMRLEAIKTINSMLNKASKETRKKIYQSEDHNFLLEEFANVIIDVGDYEMQLEITEAICRITQKLLTEELDCRIFLNELNSYFGDSRRVFSIPCIRIFLDITELFKPEDELLKMFWVDFNIGTSCISFYVNDPEETLWGLIHLPKTGLASYNLREYDDRKILSIHMSCAVSHCGATGKMVQMVFDSRHDIQTAVERVFGGSRQLQILRSSKSGPGKLTAPRSRKLRADDVFCLRDGSDTEVTVSETLDNTFLSESGRSDDRKPETITFMAAFWKYQVKRAKSVIFGQSHSSNGSVKSFPGTGSQVKSSRKKKLRVFHSESDSYVPPSERHLFRSTPTTDYTRKRPRLKSNLKVLPLSSPSSNEEEFFKESTPKQRLAEKKRLEGVSGQSQGERVRLKSLAFSLTSKETTDSGFREQTVLEDTIFDEDSVMSKKEQDLIKDQFLSQTEQMTSAGLDENESQLLSEESPLFATLKPRRLFPSTALESATETMTKSLMEEEESETELGSGVIAAFNTFKTQLKEHFSSRYKRIEAKSLRSLTDCQKNVTSLLRLVHEQRLIRLENFQDTVVQQLGVLEESCLTLKNIEKETVSFWQSESDTVRAFCDEQQKRLDSLDIMEKSAQAPPSQTETTDLTAHTSSNKHTSQSASEPNGTEAEETTAST